MKKQECQKEKYTGTYKYIQSSESKDYIITENAIFDNESKRWFDVFEGAFDDLELADEMEEPIQEMMVRFWNRHPIGYARNSYLEVVKDFEEDNKYSVYISLIETEWRRRRCWRGNIGFRNQDEVEKVEKSILEWHKFNSNTNSIIGFDIHDLLWEDIIDPHKEHCPEFYTDDDYVLKLKESGIDVEKGFVYVYLGE